MKNVDFIDLNDKNDLSKYDIFYVTGGNTFKLLNDAKVNNFEEDLESLFDRGGIFFGISAANLILSPSISLANFFEPDKNTFSDLTLDAFNLIPKYDISSLSRIF